MKDFFLYPNISPLGLMAYLIAAKCATYAPTVNWELLCYVIAGSFNWLVTYDLAAVVLKIQKRLEAMK